MGQNPDRSGQTFSKAPQPADDPAPFTLETIRNSIPPHLFKKSEIRFLLSVLFSLSLVLSTTFLAYNILPLSLYALPLWILYALINGTLATGLWVLGHECGHGAFSNSTWKNDLLGFILHSSLLVPYFSWQYSHFVHHSRCNHMTEDDGHVPGTIETPIDIKKMTLRDKIGVDAWAINQLLFILTLGWPAYLIFGMSGSPARGFTSHFLIPNGLITRKRIPKSLLSDFGLIIILYLLYLWAQRTSFGEVFALYIAPYFVTNCWLVGYTWLHHTDERIHHYDATSWNWLKGAMSTMDRNYPEFINIIHFNIGSTHILHHLFSQLPHYNCREALEYAKPIMGDCYNYDERPVWKQLWDVAKLGVVEQTEKGKWTYISRWPFFTQKKKE